jgi:hypothetical protein
VGACPDKYDHFLESLSLMIYVGRHHHRPRCREEMSWVVEREGVVDTAVYWFRVGRSWDLQCLAERLGVSPGDLLYGSF